MFCVCRGVREGGVGEAGRDFIIDRERERERENETERPRRQVSNSCRSKFYVNCFHEKAYYF